MCPAVNRRSSVRESGCPNGGSRECRGESREADQKEPGCIKVPFHIWRLTPGLCKWVDFGGKLASEDPSRHSGQEDYPSGFRPDHGRIFACLGVSTHPEIRENYRCICRRYRGLPYLPNRRVKLVSMLSRDPADDVFLETAVDGNVTLLVSGRQDGFAGTASRRWHSHRLRRRSSTT